MTKGPPAFPLSFAQERLWFLECAHEGEPLYNVPTATRLRGALNLAALEHALARLVARHEILRTRIVERDGAPCQLIEPEGRLPLARARASGEDPASRWESALALATTQARRRPRFDGELAWGLLIEIAADDHLLAFTFHHTISDGWSVGRFYEELAALYGDPTAVLPELEIQYADYAAWQREELERGAFAPSVAHFSTTLGEAPVLSIPPFDHPEAVGDARGARVPLGLSPQTWAALATAAERWQATPFALLFSIFGTVVARFIGTRDLVLGVTVANRRRRELETALGCFVNTLPVRLRWTGDPEVGALVREARSSLVRAFDHEDAPFEQIVRSQRVVRSLASNPLFQILFQVEGAPSRLALPGLGVESVELDREIAALPMTVSLRPAPGGGYQGTILYRSALYDEAGVERIGRAFERACDHLAQHPTARVSDLPLLAEAERAQLARWNDTDRPLDPTLVPDLIARRAAETPGAVAVRIEGKLLRYGELEARANQLAHALRARGVRADDIVALCLPRSLELLVAVLGVMRAGAAYLPLDLDAPRDRLAFALGDARPKLVLSLSVLRARVEGLGCPVLALDGEAAALRGEPATAPELPLHEAQAAYVLYTSGSTGQPKAVVNVHGALRNRLAWIQAEHALLPSDRVLHKTPYTFDVSVWEMLWPLCQGAELVVARPDGHLDAAYLARLIEEAQVTVCHFVPSMLRGFLDEVGPHPLPSVRRTFTSGEALPLDLVERFLAHRRATLHNLYGPTEAAIEVTAWTCRPGDPVVPIGRPIANVQMHVLDDHMLPVPVGVVGELYIGGVALARGYLGRPALTAERFVPAPAGRGERIYRTGDRARWRSDGSLEYLGRIDGQVKLRGVRVELGEIEAAVSQSPGVSACAAMVHEPRPGDQRLVAYVESPAQGWDAEALRRSLAERLPSSLIPSQLIRIDRLPLTTSGKLDRRRLPAPESGAERVFLAPRDETEREIAAVWQQVLGIDRVGVHDDFFALGGHSLLAARVAARLAQRCGVEVPLRSIFDTPILEGLARALHELRRGAKQQLPIPRVDDPRPAPLSFAQERLWFLTQLEPASAAYHVFQAREYEGELDAAALERALAQLVERHDGLRSCVVIEAGVPAQRQLPTTALRLERRALPGASDEALTAVLDEEVRRPFDLQGGPLLRCLLVHREPRQAVLLLTLHHLISDEWSLQIWDRELGLLYEAARAGTSAQLPALPIRLSDYARWERGYLDGERLRVEQAHWREELSGAPEVIVLPTDRPRPAVASGAGAVLRRSLPALLGTQLEVLGRDAGTTPFMTLLAGFVILLARYAGQLDLVVGTPVANRGRAEVQGLIGLFVNTIALRMRLSPTMTVRELLLELRETTLRGQAHEALPFDRVVDAIQPKRTLSHTPLFQVMFQVATDDPDAGALGGLRARTLELPRSTAKFELSLGVQRAGDGLRCVFEYSRDLFEEATIARLAAGYEDVLAAMVTQPTARVLELPLAPRPTQGGGKREPSLMVLHELFAASAAREPAALAVRMGEASLSRVALAQHAWRLAQLLRARGVRLEDRVAVFLPRSLDTIVALLAISAAGGAYLPIDHTLPPEALEHLLADARPRLILTSSALEERLGNAERICLDRADEMLAAQPATPPAVLVQPSNLAYVIYTSGSTGRPKGVGVEHRSYATHVRDLTERLALGPHDRMLQFCALSFDASLEEIGCALVSGAALVLRDEEAARSIEGFCAACRDAGVTILDLPTAFWHELATTLTPATLPATIRAVVIGGEAARPEAIDRWQAQFAPRVSLYNTYGPTEATISATLADLSGRQVGTAVSIGHGVPQASLYVLGLGMVPEPLGAIGELYIGGAAIARGYLAGAATTAERFLPDPYADEPGARMYRTGDLVRRRLDGELEFMGRSDAQIKLRGFRIELGAIESALAEESGVLAAAARLWSSTPTESQLVAYAVVAEGGPTVEALEASLRRRLPAQLVPSSIELLTALPHSRTGKLDRAALPPPARRASTADFTDARDRFELRIQQLWQEVLGHGPISVKDDFFAIGGNSLSAVRLMHRLGELFGVSLRVSLLFQVPTIEGLALELRDPQATRRPHSPLVPLQTLGNAPPLYLAHPFGGGVTTYARIARRLGLDQPSHGFELYRPSLPPNRIEDMAAEYADIVVSRGERRVVVGGYSTGGLIALEMARQLRQRGVDVRLLLIASLPPRPESEGAGRDEGSLLLEQRQLPWTERFVRWIGVMRMETVGERMGQVLKGWLATAERAQDGSIAASAITRGVEIGKSFGVFAPSVDLSMFQQMAEAWMAMDVALQRYRFSGAPHEGPALLVGPEAEVARAEPGWRPILPGLETRTVPGDHFSMIDGDEVASLADVIAEHLRRWAAQPSLE